MAWVLQQNTSAQILSWSGSAEQREWDQLNWKQRECDRQMLGKIGRISECILVYYRIWEWMDSYKKMYSFGHWYEMQYEENYEQPCVCRLRIIIVILSKNLESSVSKTLWMQEFQWHCQLLSWHVILEASTWNGKNIAKAKKIKNIAVRNEIGQIVVWCVPLCLL